MRPRPGRRGVRFPAPSERCARRLPPASRRFRPISVARPPCACRRSSELDLLRHFNRLSHLNHAIDLGFYPLGSCTMKYNPKVNEWAARLPGLADSHPLDPDELAQGSLELEWLLAELLKEISGLAAVSLQPAAGAQGELTGMLMTRAYHRSRGRGRAAHQGAGARQRARHQPGDRQHGRLPDRDDPLQRARRDRPRGAARGTLARTRRR